jgi:hypothetical protein
MATAPEAIEFFMALFCNTTRIVLLMSNVPWKLLVQVRDMLCVSGLSLADFGLLAARGQHWTLEHQQQPHALSV